MITKAFAPDSIISAVRTTKIAKYLSKNNNEVIVIRSGLIYGKPSKSISGGLENVSICSYEGSESPAEQFEKNNFSVQVETNNKAKGITGRCFDAVKPFLRKLGYPFVFYFIDGFRLSRKVIKLYKSNEKIRNVDAVISTFSPLGCLISGLKISMMEGCPFIIDFRDLMTNTMYPKPIHWLNGPIQKKYVKRADAVMCVSNGNSSHLQELVPEYRNKIKTIHNGFDPEETMIETHSETEKFTFCYTGTLYSGKRTLVPLFNAISKAFKHQMESIRFVYAGDDSDTVKKQAKSCGVESIIEDHGYVTREEVSAMQNSSNFFVVSTWNTKNEYGILTGKFYESIAARKPVIGIVTGDIPKSELYTLIKQYNLGMCYEEANEEETAIDLEKYLNYQYENWKNTRTVKYEPDSSVFDDFSYAGIAKHIENIIKKT